MTANLSVERLRAAVVPPACVPARKRATEGSNVPTGRVKWFNPEKGFGFLSREDGPDVFVHKDALPTGTTELKPGQRVEFGIVAGRRGGQARPGGGLHPPPPGAAAPPAA